MKNQYLVKCKNCHGTGTVFPGKTMKAASRRCPVCKGACWVPAPLTKHQR